MKKTYPVSTKVQGQVGWRKHLRKEDKRRASKSTRKLGGREIRKIVDNL